MLPLTYRSPSASSFSRRMAAGSYGPMTVELFHVGSLSVPDTTYFAVSLKNGAPGSSSAVRVDHAGSNISYVVRPSRIPLERPVNAAMASPIAGSKPYSNVQVGASITPSRLMNSCTWISPISNLPLSSTGTTAPRSRSHRPVPSRSAFAAPYDEAGHRVTCLEPQLGRLDDRLETHGRQGALDIRTRVPVAAVHAQRV